MKKLVLILAMSGFSFWAMGQGSLVMLNERLSNINTKEKNDVKPKNDKNEDEDKPNEIKKISPLKKANKSNIKNDRSKLLSDSLAVEYWPYVLEYVTDYAQSIENRISRRSKIFESAKSTLEKKSKEDFKDIIKKSGDVLDSLNKLKTSYLAKKEIFKIKEADYVKKDSIVKYAAKVLDTQEGIEDLFEAQYKLFDKEIVALKNKQKAIEAENKTLEDKKIEKAEEVKRSVGAAPAFNGFFGDNLKIVPQVSVMGSSILTPSEKDFITGGEIKFFSSGSLDKTKSQFVDMLYSDLSSYCLQLNLQSAFAPLPVDKVRKMLGLGFTTNFLGRTVNYEVITPQDTVMKAGETTSTFSNMVYTKIRAEGSILRNFLLPYINYNDIRMITNRSAVYDLNPQYKDFNGQGYFDFGTKFHLKIAKMPGLENVNLIMDLNFMSIKNVRKIIGLKTEDNLVPSIRFSIDKSL